MCTALGGQPPRPNPYSPPPPHTHNSTQVFLSLALFLAAGVAEIGGGWLVWQTVRLHKAWYLAVAGAAVLVCYGLIPCAQPVDNFGRVRWRAGGRAGGRADRSGAERSGGLLLLLQPLHPTACHHQLPAFTPSHPPLQVYAVYGAVFIIMSYLWGWAVDGVRPDTGDWVGSAIAVAGGFLAFFWPGRS